MPPDDQQPLWDRFLEYGIEGAIVGLLGAFLIWSYTYLEADAERRRRLRGDWLLFVVAGATAGLVVGLLVENVYLSACGGAAWKQTAQGLASAGGALAVTLRDAGRELALVAVERLKKKLEGSEEDAEDSDADEEDG